MIQTLVRLFWRTQSMKNEIGDRGRFIGLITLLINWNRKLGSHNHKSISHATKFGQFVSESLAASRGGLRDKE